MPQFGWADAPPHIRHHLMACVDTLQHILHDDLTGIYLHGSLAMGCFHPERSDVNLLVVVRQNLEASQLWAIIWLMIQQSGSPQAYTLAVTREGHLFPWRYPVPLLLYYSEAVRPLYEQMLDASTLTLNPNDAYHDAALTLGETRARGVTLAGRAIEYTLPTIPRPDYVDALMRATKVAHDGLMFDPVAAILTLCRAYRYLYDGALCSKDEAGQWALAWIKPGLKPIVAGMLAYYRGETHAIPFDPVDVSRCAAYLEARVSDCYHQQRWRS